MAYAVYSFASQYADTGLIGVYVGTREENLDKCLEIVAREIADIAGGNVNERELTRAKENLKGRIVLSMESTSNRMSRLGKSLITDTELLSLDRVIARDRRGGRAGNSPSWRACSSRPRRCRRAASARTRIAVPRRGRADPSRAAGTGRSVKVAVFGARGKVGAVMADALSEAGHEVVAIDLGDPVALGGCDAAVDFTQPDAVVGERRPRAPRKACRS